MDADRLLKGEDARDEGRDAVQDEAQGVACDAAQGVSSDDVTVDGGAWELTELFSALDDVRATDALKAATLSRIFAEVDARDGAAAADDAGRAPQLTLLAGGKGDEDEEGQSGREPAMGRVIPLRRRRSVGLRVAAALVVAALGLGGGVAYALPSSHVLCSTGETTFDLGVNLFGITVSAEADSDEGSEVLDGLELSGERLEGALDRLLDACEERGDMPARDMSLEVRGHFSQGELRLGEAARDILDEHAQREAANAPQAGQPTQGDQTLQGAQSSQGVQAPQGLQVTQDGQTSLEPQATQGVQMQQQDGQVAPADPGPSTVSAPTDTDMQTPTGDASSPQVPQPQQQVPNGQMPTAPSAQQLAQDGLEASTPQP